MSAPASAPWLEWQSVTQPIELPMSIFTSTERWHPERIGALALYCSDGRWGEAFDEFCHKHLNIPRYDRWAVPGGPAWPIPRRMVELGLVETPEPFEKLLQNAPVGYAPRADTLVHGDLYVLHLLVDERGELCGVIDWGDVHLADPAVDLAVAHSFLPPAALSRFQEIYGPVEPITWQIARLRALWHTLAVLNYAYHTQKKELVHECRVSLHYLAVDPETGLADYS